MNSPYFDTRTRNCNPFENDMNCCTPWNKCGYGKGDCDYDSDCQGNLVCGNRNCGEQYGHMDCCTYAITKSSTTTTMTTTMTPTDTTMTMTTTAIKNQHPFKNSTAKEKSTLFSIKTLTAFVNVVRKTLKSSFFF